MPPLVELLLVLAVFLLLLWLVIKLVIALLPYLIIAGVIWVIYRYRKEISRLFRSDD